MTDRCLDSPWECVPELAEAVQRGLVGRSVEEHSTARTCIRDPSAQASGVLPCSC